MVMRTRLNVLRTTHPRKAKIFRVEWEPAIPILIPQIVWRILSDSGTWKETVGNVDSKFAIRDLNRGVSIRMSLSALYALS